MSSISKVRLWCYLSIRKLAIQRQQGKPDQGLTLLELLVVIVMIGILAAIASSTFLNAAAKARQSEAKVNVGTMLKAQQQYYAENQKFAQDLDELSLGIRQQTKHYEYKSHLARSQHQDQDGNAIDRLSNAIAIPLSDVRGYMGKAWFDPFNGTATVRTVVCEGEIRETYFMDSKTYCN